MIDCVKKFLESDNKVFFVVTGCSLIFTDKLMSYGGASKNVIGVYQPYATEQLNNLVQIGKDKIVSKETAIKMANSAYEKFDLPLSTIVVSCTASLCKSTGERDGRVNESFICIKNPLKENVERIEFDKYPNFRDNSLNRRNQEEQLADELLSMLFDFVEEKNV